VAALTPLARGFAGAGITFLVGIGGSFAARKRWGHPVSWVAAAVVPVLTGAIVYFFATR
jgi:hypothetical protein